MGRLIIELVPSLSPRDRKTYVFENGKATIGRSYSSDVILYDPFVSPTHLTVVNEGDDISIFDLDSGNGTKLSDKSVLRNQTRKVKSGEEIIVGKTKLKVFLPSYTVEPEKIIDSSTFFKRFLDGNLFAVVLSFFVLGLAIWHYQLGTPGSRLEDKATFLIVGIYFIFGCGYCTYVDYSFFYAFHIENLKRHLAAFNIGVLVWIAFSILDPFLFFWAKSNLQIIVLTNVIKVGIVSATLYLSLKLTKGKGTRMDHWSILLMAIFSMIIFVWKPKEMKTGFLKDPSYPAKIAPYLGPLSEPSSIDLFLDESGRKLFKNEK